MLVQLPVLSADLAYPAEHVPLGAASVGAYAFLHLPGLDLKLLPRDLCTWGGDEAIVNEILLEDPGVVAFSCYLWNVERSCYIAEQLRSRGCRALTVAGGPEVCPDNTWLLNKNIFDHLFIGEGEKAFAEFLSCLARGMRVADRVLASEPLRPEELVSPYLTGLLQPAPSGSILMESLRGCSYRCAYCFYHKSSGLTRALPIERVVSEILWARDRGVREVLFTDPSFLARPDASGFLDTITPYTGGLDLYVELNAEHCSGEIVKKLKDCGVVQVEVGLQTVNSKALKSVGRKWSRKNFVEGVKRLRDAGIVVTLDIIVGLPHDTLDDVIRSIDFAIEKELYDELNIYPLSLLPGTELRKKAAELGIRFMIEPPYYVLKTPWLDYDEIYQAFSYAEEVTGFDFFPVEVPYLGSLPGNFLSVIELEGDVTPATFHSCSCSLSIIIKNPGWWERIESVKSFATSLINKNPYILLNWIIPSKLVPEGPAMLPFLRKLYLWRQHPLDREFFSTRSSVNSCQVFITRHDPLSGDSNVWIWIPPEDTGDGEFRIIPENTDENVAEDWARSLLRKITGEDNPGYRIGEVMYA